jgi:inorganic pyrophosphatase
MQDCIIEIPKNSYIKYEIENGQLCVDRILTTPMPFPFNYGYIPKTLGEDGDPLDVVLISDFSLIPGCKAKIKVIGILDMEDEKGVDEKIIGTINSERRYENINDINQLDKQTLHDIKYFFTHYKDNEQNKFSLVKEFHDKNYALKIINRSVSNYR